MPSEEAGRARPARDIPVTTRKVEANKDGRCPNCGRRVTGGQQDVHFAELLATNDRRRIFTLTATSFRLAPGVEPDEAAQVFVAAVNKYMQDTGVGLPGGRGEGSADNANRP